MALSGSIKGSCDNSKYTLTCEWSATQSVTNNTSTITAKVYLNGNGYTTDSGYWDCTINGTQVTNDKSAAIGGNTLLGQRTWTVNHASDGTCSVTISFSFTNGATASTYLVHSGSGSEKVTLNQIARTSSFTLSSSSLDMGASQTVNITRASSSFTHTIEYTFGGVTTNAVTKTDKTSYSFIPSLELAKKIPNATSGTCTVKVTTYSGSTSIGTASKTFTLKVPASVKPTVSLAATYNSTLSGLCIAGKSTVKVTPTGTGSYSSTISSYTYSGAGLSGTGSSKTTGTLNAGTYTITVTVKDSRGRTNTASTSFTVHAYSNPSISATVYRCNSSGTATADGTYAKIKASWSVSNPNGANTNVKQYKIEWKKSTATSWSVYKDWTNLSAYSGSNQIIDCGSGWVNTTSYDVRMSVKDSYTTATSTSKITTISVIFNVEKGGVGVGKIYERGALDVGGDIYSSARFISNGNGKEVRVGTGSTDVYLYNSISNRYLQLKDDGTLKYNDWTIWHSGNTPYSASGNRWGVAPWVSTDGVMEIGKYLDFHESDGSTADYSARITSSNGDLYTSADTLFMNGSTIKLGYHTTDACTYISNANGSWLRLKDDGGITWRGYNVLTSNGTQTASGGLNLGNYDTNTFYCTTYKRGETEIGDFMVKVGASVTSSAPAVALEVGKTDSAGTWTLARRLTFSTNYLMSHTDNAVTIGSSTYRFKAVYAANGTIQTSDGRYKYILEDINDETCYNLIKDTNLYGYSSLNKRIDEYTDMAEISDELQESSTDDSTLHMGIVAQEIEDSELAKYILIKDELEDEKGKPTGEYKYGIDNYGYTTAVHGALKHEIDLRDRQIEELQQENQELKERMARIEAMLGVR